MQIEECGSRMMMMEWVGGSVRGLQGVGMVTVALRGAMRRGGS
jgi:hypothetical protein